MNNRSIAGLALALTVIAVNSLSLSVRAFPIKIAEIPTKDRVEIDLLEAVQLGEYYGFVDRDGRIAIEPKFERAYNFVEGLAAVKIKGKWGYIDRSGHLKIGHRFDSAMNFVNGKAKVRLKNKWGSIDRAGNFIPYKV